MTADDDAEVGEGVGIYLEGELIEAHTHDDGTRLWTIRLESGETAYLEIPPGHFEPKEQQ